jgi:hypothetical protein
LFIALAHDNPLSPAAVADWLLRRC